MSKRVIRLVVTGMSIGLFAAPRTYADRLRNTEIGQPMPAFALKTLEGRSIGSAALRDKVTVVLFVAATQRSSEQAAIAAHNLVRTLRQRDLNLLFVTADVMQEAYFRQFRDKVNVHEPLALDINRTLYGQLGLIVLPTSLVVDRQGKLAYIVSGYKSDYAHVLESYVRRTLGMIDDDELRRRLTARTFRRDRPSDRAARHCAAAKVLRSKGLLADAERELEAALEVDPVNTAARLDLASLHLIRKNVPEASRLVGEVLEHDPTHRLGKLMHGIVLFHQNALDKAEPVLQEALMLNPDPARTDYYLGRLYEKKGEKDRALAHYRKALRRLLDEPAD